MSLHLNIFEPLYSTWLCKFSVHIKLTASYFTNACKFCIGNLAKQQIWYLRIKTIENCCQDRNYEMILWETGKHKICLFIHFFRNRFFCELPTTWLIINNMSNCFLQLGHGLLDSKAFLIFNKRGHKASTACTLFLLGCELRQNWLKEDLPVFFILHLTNLGPQNEGHCHFSFYPEAFLRFCL